MVTKMFAVLFLYLFVYAVDGLPKIPVITKSSYGTKCHTYRGVSKYMMYFNTDVMVSDDGQSKDFIETSGIMVEWCNDTTAYMHGSVKFLKQFGEKTMVDVKLEKELSGQREIVFSHVICDLCKELGNENSKYYKYVKNIGVPQCPFDAGEYPIYDCVVNSEDFPLNTNTAGRYVVTLYIYSNPSGDCLTKKSFLASITLGLSVEME